MKVEEVWKVIDDFPDYQISNLGKVKRVIPDRWNHKLKILNQSKNKNHYFINLWKNGKKKQKQIHILVYETFNNYKLKNNECVHHIDENPENNILKNLKLMTKYNHNVFHNKNEKNPNYGKHCSDKTKNKIGLSNRGRNSELEEWQVKAVYQISNSPIIKRLKITQKEIGDIFGINKDTVYNIKNRKTFKYFTVGL